jgi:hypothetical protein
VYRVRWEIEPVLRPHNVGYKGINYGAPEWHTFESCRYRGLGAPTSRLSSLATGFKIGRPPPPRGDEEILASTRPLGRAYDKRWAVWKLYQISCLPDLDFFEVRKLDFAGDDVSRRTKSQKKTQPDRLYNLYVPDWHETAYIDKLRDLSPDPRMAESITDVAPTVFTCQLSAGLARLSIWSRWIGADGMDIMITLRVADRLLANLVQFERCAFIGRLSFRAADRSFTLDGYPPNDRFILVDDERGGLIDDTIGAPTHGQRFPVFGEDPERIALNKFFSCRYTGPSSWAWGDGLH